MGGATAQVDGAAGPALAGGDAQHAAADSTELAHAKPISAGSSRADTPVAEQGAAARPIPEGVPVARTPADAPAAETSDGEAAQVSQTPATAGAAGGAGDNVAALQPTRTSGCSEPALFAQSAEQREDIEFASSLSSDILETCMEGAGVGAWQESSQNDKVAISSATLKILERAGDFAKERDGASTSAAVLLAGLQDLDQLRGEVDASEVGETLADSRIRLLFALHAAASATTAARTDETDKEKLARSEAEVTELRGEVGRLQAEVSRLSEQNAQLQSMNY